MFGSLVYAPKNMELSFIFCGVLTKVCPQPYPITGKIVFKVGSKLRESTFPLLGNDLAACGITFADT